MPSASKNFVCKRVKAVVPGTTANLGPGFDTLGIALNVYNTIEVTTTSQESIEILSPIAESERNDATQMLVDAATLFWKRTRRPRIGLQVSLTGDVPIARGLGSSVTARLGLVAAINELCEGRLERQKLFEIVSELEHHPDNAAPAVFGGFNAAGMFPDGARTFTTPVKPELHFVTLVPDFQVSTEKARKLVPKQFSKEDTVHNLNRSALVTAAFLQQDYERLSLLLEDKVHQPYRQQLIPQLFEVIGSGVKAGAIGGWLSGSGSTIMCITLRNPQEVGQAMQKALPNSRVLQLRADNIGFQVGPATKVC